MKNFIKILVALVALVGSICAFSYLFNKPVYISNQSDEDYII